jgi:outer membrane immunogenic protein
MKKVLLAGAAAIALIAGSPANAADLGTRPTYKAPPPAIMPVAVFNWTGCYIGGHIGGGWGQKDFDETPIGVSTGVDGFFVGGVDLQSAQVGTSGFLGGGQVGCDFQFAPSWVIGIAGDGSGADVKGDASDPSTERTFRAKTD